ncbi:amidohydrolase family protein [Paenibacillus sacheonensis]|uniref:Amidohydrolase family protein n=1 Tax=Paenibacillus sacheonensis TaxID=742054 RepID=A0A7X4YQW5_9BACL|nr:amidohydrolase family protein [Paenibacillus sacheonensis]MBM7567220.1 hypothetical protein [Paenibacillus sacheonensis]NBC70855.1 amidohydrolase family protein [Paenibacillus sacheonensis]
MAKELYAELRAYLDTVPVINTHDHHIGSGGKVTNPFGLYLGYLHSDLDVASGLEDRAFARLMNNGDAPIGQKWEAFAKVLPKVKHTAYYRYFMAGLTHCWGVTELTESNFRMLMERSSERDTVWHDRIMAEAGIRASVVDISGYEDFRNIMNGKVQGISDNAKFAVPLPELHLILSIVSLQKLSPYAKGPMRELDDFMAAFDGYLDQAVQFGAVCLKDQSAYRRALDYEMHSKPDIERIFTRLIQYPREALSYVETKPIDDWLFSEYARRGAKRGLPLQLHTGHMAGTRNDVRKANAALLIPFLETHPDVKVGLFHGNWPYMDEYLFIGKNYPNVWLDLCWCHIIDPDYTVELMKRALKILPYNKVLAFGADAFTTELTYGYLVAARDNVARALSELVEEGWLSLNDAKTVAEDWFFNNPNEFFGFKPEAGMADRDHAAGKGETAV